MLFKRGSDSRGSPWSAVMGKVEFDSPRRSPERNHAATAVSVIHLLYPTTRSTPPKMSDKGNSNMLFANFNQDFTLVLDRGGVRSELMFTTSAASQWARRKDIASRTATHSERCTRKVSGGTMECRDGNVNVVPIAADGAHGIVEMLFCTSLIALVGAADQPSSSPRKLQIVNTKVGSSKTPSSVGPDVILTRYSSASIHDLRTALPFLYPRCQAQQEDSCGGTRAGDLHLRY